MSALRAILLLLVLPFSAQDPTPEPLWLPEGYRLLSLEERSALSAAELRAIGESNQKVLHEAVQAMAPPERQGLLQHLERAGQGGGLSDVEKQYVTMLSMLLLARAVEDEDREQGKEVQRKFDKLLRDQEERTKGFPTDPESVEPEVRHLASLVGREDPTGLYLKVLRPLRAHPWNNSARVLLGRVVRPPVLTRAMTDAGRPTLLEAAVRFAKARQQESPDEGAWYSLEASLRLSMRGEVDEAKRLYAIAIGKNSRDLECRLFPLLIAEIEQNEQEVARLLPRAREAWPKGDDLQRMLYGGLISLPEGLRKKAKTTFEAKYKREHPGDWQVRIAILEKRFWEKDFAQVESETSSLLALPATALPEPHRTDALALNLRAKARTGRCFEVEHQISTLESRAEAAYPREFDPDSPPVPRTASDARGLKEQVAQAEIMREQLRKALETGSFEKDPQWSEIPSNQRRAFLEGMLAELREQIPRMGELVAGRDDVQIAADWSRRELEDWEKGHGITPDRVEYSVAPQAQHVAKWVRAATGECYLAKGDAVSAVRLLRPCSGSGRNLHRACLQPLIEAGVALAREGSLPEAIAIYEFAVNSQAPVHDLFEAIEAAAPGSVKPKTAPPNRAMRSP